MPMLISGIILLLAFFAALVREPLSTQHDLLSRPYESHPAERPRFLLLTAHPDDEVMFFGPTVVALTTWAAKSRCQSQMHNQYKTCREPVVFSLCLATGDAYGLGDVRKNELGRSLDILGVDADKRWVIDHPDLKDNITLSWNPVTIARVLEPYVLEHKIGTVLTFDRYGISSHPNHASLPCGVQELIRQLHQAALPVPRLFTLTTVSIIPKYLGVVAAIWANISVVVARWLRYLGDLVILVPGAINPTLSSLPRHFLRPPSEISLVYVSGMREYSRALRAMTAHKSQLVWFRWLYVLFSRYMWVNAWVEVTV